MHRSELIIFSTFGNIRLYVNEVVEHDYNIIIYY